MNNCAFLVACSSYNDHQYWHDLPDTQFDLNRMKSALEENCGCLSENLICCSQDLSSAYKPEYTKIIPMIEEELNNRNKIFDIVFFYFSGHGYSKDGEVYIVPEDAHKKGYVIPINEIIQAIERIAQTSRIVLIIDCCQNELVDKSSFMPLSQFKGHVVFYSCPPKGYSYMIPDRLTTKYGKGSIFTLCIAEALSKGSKCRTVGEVSSYTKEKIRVVCDEASCDQLPYTSLQDETLNELQLTENSAYTGYFIHFGPTTCRVFMVPRNTDEQLKEVEVKSYNSTLGESLETYLEKVKKVARSLLKGIKESEDANENGKRFIKAFAEAGFIRAFEDKDKKVKQKELNRFIWELYTSTKLSLTVLSYKQEVSNLLNLFKNAITGDDGIYTAIINIGKQYVDIHYINKSDQKVESCDLPVSIQMVEEFIKQRSLPSIWNNDDIYSIKEYVKSLIKGSFENRHVKRAIILKDELWFMQNYGYPIKVVDGCYYELSIDEYKKANRDILFKQDFLKFVKSKNKKEDVDRIYGFRIGHIILETVFELLDVETIIPDNAISIHGNVGAYIFNVALSGSRGKPEFFEEAKTAMESLKASVLSPLFVAGELKDQTQDSDFEHALAIRECDMLFVCNKDGYIGPQTSCEIYGAYIAGKPIAYWKTPTGNNENYARLDFIPHEIWDTMMDNLIENAKRKGD